MEWSYEQETKYVASVEVHGKKVSIFFSFYHWQGKKMLWVAAPGDSGFAQEYDMATTDEILYKCPEGTWVLCHHYGENSRWVFKGANTCLYEPTISLANEEPEFKGRHYDALIMDDIPMGSKSSSPEEVKKATEWYKTQYHLKPKYMREVKKKMLQLIDVIFFNRKTKAVDYRKEIVAVDIEEAYMLAAQDYGKFNSKVHVRNANCLFSFVEDDKE